MSTNRFGIHMGQSTIFCLGANHESKVALVAPQFVNPVYLAELAESVAELDESGTQSLMNHNCCYEPLVMSHEVAFQLFKTIYENVRDSFAPDQRFEVVVAFPELYSEASCRNLISAAAKAGCNIRQTMSEANAALLAYEIGFDANECSNVLVYRSGGQSSALTLYHVANGHYVELGNVHLNYGGKMITETLARFMTPFNSADDEEDVYRNYGRAEYAKRILSTMRVPQVYIRDVGSMEDALTLARLELAVNYRLALFVQPIHDLLAKHPLNVDKVILCGGNMIIPLIQSTIIAEFPNAQILNSIKPDEVIAFGCARRASYMAFDIAPLNLMTGEGDVEVPARNAIVYVETSPDSYGGAVFASVSTAERKSSEDNEMSAAVWTGEVVQTDASGGLQFHSRIDNGVNEIVPATVQYITNETFDNEPSLFQCLNEDCLRHLFQYLNVIDAANVSRTCKRLEAFANDVMLPPSENKIKISCENLTKAKPTEVSIELDHEFKSDENFRGLSDVIRFFGQFIEYFILIGCTSYPETEKLWRSVVHVLKHCPNLKALSIYRFPLNFGRVQELQRLVESFPKLESINVLEYPGIRGKWPSTLRKNTTIKKLSVITSYDHENYMDYFRNVTTLTIDLPICRSKDLRKIFDHYEHSLKSLRLYGPDNLDDDDPLLSIVTDKLRNLERLECAVYYGMPIDSPLLKALSIFYDFKNVNKILRKVSNDGVIERLDIYTGMFEAEDADAPPYNFAKLRSFTWYADNYYRKHCLMRIYALQSVDSLDCEILKSFTKSEMPEICNVKIKLRHHRDLNYLWNFVESKPTIETIRLVIVNNEVIPLQLWQRLLQILRRPCTPQRPIITFSIYYGTIGADGVELLNANRDVIKVDHKIYECDYRTFRCDSQAMEHDFKIDNWLI